MNPSPREGWGLPPNVTRPGEQPPRSTAPNAYGHSPQTSQQPPPASTVLPPPPGGSFYSSHPTGAPNLPAIPGIPQQPPPLTPGRAPLQTLEQGVPAQTHNQQHPPPTYSLPGLNQPSQSQPMQTSPHFPRDREVAEPRERSNMEIEYDSSRREQPRDREMPDPPVHERSQATPQQSHAEPVQMHAPVPVGPQMRNIQNGLLSNGAQQAGPALPQPPPNGQVMVPPQYERTPQGGVQQTAVQNLIPFPGEQGMQQMAAQGVGPGQQPILNDALSYLDQVKVQFAGNPDVYNQFLDIMKDFKSQAIDTPGVIGRVSQLFKGNPGLIQGFNTFLPPGYRIECGTADDPNQIRVTTPMGTTHSPMGTAVQPPSERRAATEDRTNDAHAFEPNPHGDDSRWPGSYHQKHTFSSGTPAHGGPTDAPRTSPFSAGPGHAHQRGVNEAILAHQQEERGVTQLQNAVSAATGMSPMAEPSGPVVGGPNGIASAQQGGAGAERRNGPVEFNHAISYVNKIKNRFASQPEIYKQFLEILQTYQRESKPIQDVYAQVTHLFNGAPDLLEDFKQFLPESAAHHKAAQAQKAAEDATMVSHSRGDYGGQHQTPRATDQGRLPPMGQFAPTPSAGREGKRKRGADRQGASQVPGANAQDGGKNAFVSHKQRGKQPTHTQHTSKYATQADVPSVEPNLVPALPEPMPPSTASAATGDEVALFDRIKKYLGNKNSMTEFLKLCNLYSQDLIDKNLLVYRAQSFIGSNPELFAYFKTFLNYDGRDQIIENKARLAVTGRVNLNNCRALGQSYRHLPQRERYKPCSGRDELCNSVLNDEWVSHPTWASEDSGFIAHKKNTYEESLHRIEEERHDYDLHISSLERMITFLEPLAQQIYSCDDATRRQWHLDPDFAGQSHPIYQKMLGKIYGREHVAAIMQDMIAYPANVIPIVIQRSRQIVENWKQTQREWEKVWRDQTQRMFYRSLDHQGISAKQNDKRQFQSKTLQNEVQAQFEEQKRARLSGNRSSPKYQFQHHFADEDVIFDAAKIVLIYADQHHAVDLPRLQPFLQEFVPLFFGFDLDTFQERMNANFVPTSTPGEDEAEDGATSEDASSGVRGRRMDKDKRDLRRGVLDRGRSGKPRGDKDDHSASHSRASTPGAASATNLTDEQDLSDRSDEGSEPQAQTWIHYYVDAQGVRKRREIKPNEPYRRKVFNLYGNLPIYCFFRMFTILYERLVKLKNSESGVREVVRRSREKKVAADLGMLDKDPSMFFADTSSNANYYVQMLGLFEELIRGEIDTQLIEDILRRFYLQTGWQLFSFERMLSSLTRFAIAIFTTDGAKDRNTDILEAFKKDRRKEHTTHADELTYRRQVEKYIKDSDVYRIAYNTTERKAFVRLLKRDESTYDSVYEDGLLDPEQRWAYYVASFTSLEPTESVLLDEVRLPFLKKTRQSARSIQPARPTKAGKRNAEDPEGDHEMQESNERSTQPSGDTLKQLDASRPKAADSAPQSKDVIDLQPQGNTRWDQLRSREHLGLRIDQENYKLNWPGYGTGADTEWWYADDSGPTKAATATTEAKGDAQQAGAQHVDAEGEGEDKDGGDTKGEQDEKHDFEERFVMNNTWMKGLSRDEVDEKNRGFREWVSDGDVEMGG